LCHELNVKLHVDLYINVNDICNRLERVGGKKRSASLCGENGGEIFGGHMKTIVTLFYCVLFHVSLKHCNFYFTW